jgi:predicted nuclease of predicted toxin-antitoxin system
MDIRVLADEGLNGNIVRELRKHGFEVEWVLEIDPGIGDLQVIELAKSRNCVLITEDKDFGEWVFAHQIRGATVILLRYEKQDFSLMVGFLITVLGELAAGGTSHEFITLNKNRVRRRTL